MNDFINDYRGSINRRQKYKYNNSNKWRYMNRSLYKRLPTRSNKKHMLLFPDASNNLANYFPNDEIQLESLFKNPEDALAFELNQLSDYENIDQIETTYFYCILHVSRKLLDTYHYLKKYLENIYFDQMKLFFIEYLEIYIQLKLH